MPFTKGCTAGAAKAGPGDWVDLLSPLIAGWSGGEPEFALLPGLASDEDRANPLIGGVGLWETCRPLTPAWTACLWRARASLSIEVPGTEDSRCWDRLSITFGLGPPILSLGAEGPSTLSLACWRTS